MLERVPDGRTQWTPHAKSRTMGELASHIGNLPRLSLITIESDELYVSPPNGVGATPRFDSTANLVRAFDDKIHHRGQLSVYLRLNGVPLPSVYGPSADTKG